MKDVRKGLFTFLGSLPRHPRRRSTGGWGWQGLLALLLLLVSAAALAEKTVTTTYYYTDVLGSVVATADAQGNILSRRTYQPYGAIHAPDPTDTEALGYTGKPLDASGLQYFGARYFDPRLGRFMGIDPVGFVVNNPHSFNRYAYANNNPYKYIDPDGRYADLILEAASLALGAHNFSQNMAAGNYGAAAVDGVGLVVDGILAVIPGLPGIAGASITAAREGTEIVAKGVDETVDLYRAVSPAEFDDIAKTGQFNLGPSGFGKQFGYSFDEIMKLSDYLPDTAAIIKAKVPKSALNGLDHTPVDRHILKSGTVTAHPEKLDQFNKEVQNIEHRF